jgi:hypothetical protein
MVKKLEWIEMAQLLIAVSWLDESTLVVRVVRP